MTEISNNNFSIFTNINGCINNTPIVSISRTRVYGIYKIYDMIKKWSNRQLDKIPDSLVYLNFQCESHMRKKAFRKACMIEELIHKDSLFKADNHLDHIKLNYAYYSNLHIYLYKLKNKKIFQKNYKKIDYQDNSKFFFIKEKMKGFPKDPPSKTSLETSYTFLSFFEEYMLIKDLDIRKRTKKEEHTILNFDVNLYDYGSVIIHNGETLNEPFNCIVCADNCTEYADCMYSNCRHMCMCYNCSKKLEPSKRTTCIICRQHNDRIIQVFKP